MKYRTITDINFGGAYYGKIVAKHWVCHSIITAEISRLMKFFN